LQALENALRSSGYRIAGFVAPNNSYLAKAIEGTCYFVTNPASASWYGNVVGRLYLQKEDATYAEPPSTAPSSLWVSYDITGACIVGYMGGEWHLHNLPFTLTTRTDDIESLLEIQDYTVSSFGILNTGILNTNGTTYKHGVLIVTEGQSFILANNHVSSDNVRYAFATQDYKSSGATISTIIGSVGTVNHGTKVRITVPSGCTHLLFNAACSSYQAKIYGIVDNWHFSTGEKVTSVGIDATPTKNSENLVKSGGVRAAIEQERTMYTKPSSVVLADWETGQVSGEVGGNPTLGTQGNWKRIKVAVPEEALSVTARLYYRSSYNYAMFFLGSDGKIVSIVNSTVTGSSHSGDEMNITMDIPSGATHVYLITGINTGVEGATVSNCRCSFNLPAATVVVREEINKERASYTVVQDVDLSGWAEGQVSGEVGGDPGLGTQSNWVRLKLDIPESALSVSVRLFYRSGYNRALVFLMENGKIESIVSTTATTSGATMDITADISAEAKQVYLITGINTGVDGATAANCRCSFQLPVNVGLESEIADIHDELNDKVYGTTELAYTIMSKCIRQAGTQGSAAAKAAGYDKKYGDGYLTSVSNYRSFVYDLSSVTADTITIQAVSRTNFHSYVFLRATEQSNLGLKTADSSDISKWQAAYCDQPMNTIIGTSTTRSKHVVTKPADAGYLVVLGYTNATTGAVNPVVTIESNPDSISSRLEALKGNEESWVASERTRIEALLNAIITHELVIFGFNTDQHIKSSNREGIIRGLKVMKQMAEKYNFDLIVLGGDDTYSSDKTVSSVIADINDVNNTPDTTACPVVNLVGNHEGGQNITKKIPVVVNGETKQKTVWDTDKWNARTMYRLKTQRLLNRKQVVWAAPIGENCIIDDEVKHCRYVFLDNWSKVEGMTEPVVSGFDDNGTWVYWFRYTLNYALSDSKLENSDWKVYLFSHSVIPPFLADENGQALDCGNLSDADIDAVDPYVVDINHPVTEQHPYAPNRRMNGYGAIFGSNYFLDEDSEDGADTNTFYRANAKAYNSMIKGAINRGVNIVMGISGHIHTAGWRSDNGILFACTGSAGESSNSQSFERRKYVIGTDQTETLFDIYIHDITDQKVYALAYGEPSDRIWDLSGSDPVLLLCNLSGTVSASLEGDTITASYHNTTFEAELDNTGA
jgi:hypothetical protein